MLPATLATMAAQRAILADDRQSRAQGAGHVHQAVSIAAICGASVGGVLAERGCCRCGLLSALLCLLATLLFGRVRPPPTNQQTGTNRFSQGDLLRLMRQHRFAALMLGSAIPAKIALAGLLFT